MKKLLNLCLLLTSLFGYLHWGKNQHAFLYEGEWAFFRNLGNDPEGLLNPFVLLPVLGQILLLVTLFQRQPGKIPTFAGMACLSVIMLFLLFIGITKTDLRITVSVLPFLTTALWVVWYYRKKK